MPSHLPHHRSSPILSEEEISEYRRFFRRVRGQRLAGPWPPKDVEALVIELAHAGLAVCNHAALVEECSRIEISGVAPAEVGSPSHGGGALVPEPSNMGFRDTKEEESSSCPP